MQEYKFISNKRIIKITYIISIFLFVYLTVQVYFSLLRESVIMYLLVGVILVMLFILTYRYGNEIYQIDSEKIIKIKESKKIIKWDDIKAIVIADWYITIIPERGFYYSIRISENNEETFEKIKESILLKVDSDKIHYNELNGKIKFRKEGNLGIIVSGIVLYILVRGLQAYLSIRVIVDVNISHYFDMAILIYMLLAISVIGVIWGSIVLVGIIRKKKSAIRKIKPFLLYAVISYILFIIVSFILAWGKIEIYDICILALKVVVNILLVFYAIEYFKSSVRVKNTFVK